MLHLVAQIRNPVLPDGYGGGRAGDGVSALTGYIILLWRTLILVGGMAALLFLLWGAIDWIISGGDQGKVDSARKKMTSAVIGLTILASSVAIVELISTLTGYDLLLIEFPTPTP
jgi:hypothetical protein